MSGNNSSYLLKRILPVVVSISLLALLFLFHDIDTELISAFDMRLFLIFLVVAILISILGSLRLYFNLKPFYRGISFGVAHQVNVYSMVSGLFFAGIIGSTITKISLPFLNKVNKNLFIIISLVEKTATIGFISIIGIVSFLILKYGNTEIMLQFENSFNLSVVAILIVSGSFVFFRKYIVELFSLISAFFFNNSLYSLMIVILNLIPIFLILNNLLDISTAEKIIYTAALMFAGSLPISFQGMGVREAAAVYMLSQYNINTSILVGNILMVSLASILAICVMPLTIHFFQNHAVEYEEKKETVFHSALIYIEENLGLLSIPCIVFCMFETRITLFQTSIPIAFGDFFAAILFFILIGSVINKKIDKQLSQLIMILISILFYFVLSFLYGWYNNGFSSWALNNRIIGGLILLGYVQAGFLFLRNRDDFIRQTLVIICWILGLYLFVYLFFRILQYCSIEFIFKNFPRQFYTTVFSGPSVHPITFAFLLCMVSILFFMSFSTGVISKRLLNIFLFLASICIGLTQSINGMIAGLGISLVWFFKEKKHWVSAITVFTGIALSLPISMGIFSIPNNRQIEPDVIGRDKGLLKIQILNEQVAKFEMWQKSWKLSLGILKQHWLFGLGLGGTLDQFKKNEGGSILPYNSILLYSIDTGMIGILLIWALFFWIYSLEGMNKTKNKLFRGSFWSAILCMVVFSISDDISYQRFLWIWIGMFVSFATKPEKLYGNSGWSLK